MRMVEILEASINMERCQLKDMGSEVTKTRQTKESWKGKEDVKRTSKPKPNIIHKLSKEEVLASNMERNGA